MNKPIDSSTLETPSTQPDGDNGNGCDEATWPVAPGALPGELRDVPFDQITIPRGRTTDWLVVEAIKDSIRRVGLLHAPVVVADGVDHYRLGTGANRLQACRELRYAVVRVFVVDAATFDAKLAAADENLCRRQLTKAQQKELRRFRDTLITKGRAEGKSLAAVAEATGVSCSTAHRRANALRSTLPPEKVDQGPGRATPKTRGRDGKTRPARLPSAEDKTARREKARALRGEGRSVRSVARELGVSVGTAVADLNVPPAQVAPPSPVDPFLQVGLPFPPQTTPVDAATFLAPPSLPPDPPGQTRDQTALLHVHGAIGSVLTAVLTVLHEPLVRADVRELVKAQLPAIKALDAAVFRAFLNEKSP